MRLLALHEDMTCTELHFSKRLSCVSRILRCELCVKRGAVFLKEYVPQGLRNVV